MSTHTMNKTAKIIAVFVLMLTLSILTQKTSSTKVPDEMNCRIDTGKYEIQMDAQGYHKISMYSLDYGVINSPGDPVLPEKIIELRVPMDIDWSSVQLTFEIQEAERLPGSYRIPPNPPYKVKYRKEWGYGKSIMNGKNTKIYARDAFYPDRSIEMLPYTEKKVSTEWGYEDARFVRIAYRPFLYNPVREELILNKRAEIKITYNLLYSIKRDAEIRSTTYDYVIITTNNIVANSEYLKFFIHHKELAGHSVKVVTEDDFDYLTGEPPNERPEKIRQWLKNNKDPLGIDYVLLIGNPDPDDPHDPTDTVGDIPMKWCWTKWFFWADRDIPTDYYYADLTGNWDLDGDGLFGEDLDVNNEKSPHWPSNVPVFFLPEDYFSVVWAGKVMCDLEGDYIFQTFSDDGAMLWIDGNLVIDHWIEHPPENKHVTIPNMKPGKHDIYLRFRENTGDGIITLLWQPPNALGVDVIPEDKLYDYTDNSGGLTGWYYNNPYCADPPLFSRGPEKVMFWWGTGDQGVKGSEGGPDPGADVFVGRIPVYDNDYSQLDKILYKIIKYETDPGDISWRKKILLPMEPHSAKIPAYPLGEWIKNRIAEPAGFYYFRIYEEDYNPPTPELWPCNPNNVKNEWINGYGMTVWATHGNIDLASDVIDSYMTPLLDDTKPSFTLQASCSNAYPEANNNLAYSLLKHGAIATVAATRGSGHEGGDPNWLLNPTYEVNHNLAFFYTKNIIENGYPAGTALYETKKKFISVSVNGTAYNLYGDPECFLLFTVPNHQPVSDPDGPYTGDEGSLIAFDGSASHDPEGDPLEYRWDFQNDNTWDTPWSTNPTNSHIYGDDFSGTIKLEVRDSIGLTGESSASLTIINVAPSVTIDSLIQPNPQFILPIIHKLIFHGSFSDPGWLDKHTAEWDFGDTINKSGTLTEENIAPYSKGYSTADHVYSEPGTFNVILIITDDDGGIGSNTIQVKVMTAKEALEDLDHYMEGLPDSCYKNSAKQRKKALHNKFAAIAKRLSKKKYKTAIQKLKKDIRAKADGLIDGDPKGDWIIEQLAQKHICMKIDDLIAYMEMII